MTYGYRTSFTAADKADREETIVDGRFSSSGDIAISDGSVTQGAIYFADDKNTGIYSESDGQIDITTEGKKRFSITNSGVVILNRGHGSDNSSLILDKANGGYGQISFEDQGAQKSYIKVDSSENTVFQNTGTLQLYGKSQYGLDIGTNGQVQLRYLGSSKLETNANGIAITGTTNGEQATFGGSSSGLKISTWQKTNNDAGVTLDAVHSSNGTLAFNTAGTERLRITKDGYLRYSGSSNADETNKIGRILARSHDTGEEDVLYFNMEQENTFNQLTIGGGSASYNAATKIIFRTAAIDTVTGVNRLEIDSNGNSTFGGQLTIPSKASTYEGITLSTPNGDGSGEFHIGVHEAGTSNGRSIVFKRGGTDGMDTESMRIDNAGTTIFSGVARPTNNGSLDLGSGSNKWHTVHTRFVKIGTSTGDGIQFNTYGEDDSNAATTVTSNTLDDYEEGTWVAVIKSGSNTITFGSSLEWEATYTKIGRKVTINLTLENTTTAGTTGGEWKIEGLPFSAKADDRTIGSIVNSQVLVGNTWPAYTHLNGGSSTLDVYCKTNAASTYAHSTVSGVGANTYLQLQHTYFTA
jgi:hypothetical protein